VEVVGWLVRRLRIRVGAWVLVISPVNLLAASLVIRGPVGLNAVWGIPVEHNLDEVTAAATRLATTAKLLDGLPGILWDHGNVCM
jgi:hypothetical protein